MERTNFNSNYEIYIVQTRMVKKMQRFPLRGYLKRKKMESYIAECVFRFIRRTVI